MNLYQATIDVNLENANSYQASFHTLNSDSLVCFDATFSNFTEINIYLSISIIRLRQLQPDRGRFKWNISLLEH